MNWNQVRKTVDATIRDHGVWYGLADADWVPIATVAPTSRPVERHTRLAAPELAVDLPGTVDGQVSVVSDELIAPNLGVFDKQGYFDAANVHARNLIVQRPGKHGRQAYFIPYVDASGASSPEAIHAEGAGLLSLLAAHPCPSIPESWRGGWSIENEDAGGLYGYPRIYSLVEFATRADGYTMSGPAERVIRNCIQDSLDAVRSHMAKTDSDWERPHLVVDYSETGRFSPKAYIRVQDDHILQTVEETARNAGVNISADLWWPGDDPVLVRSADRESFGEQTWEHPIGVVRVEQMEE